MEPTYAPKPGHTQEELVAWLEALMRMTGWSPSRLAKEAGIAASTVNKFMAGSPHVLSVTTVSRILTVAERRIRQRVAAGEVSFHQDLLRKDGSPADRMVRLYEVDPRRRDAKMQDGQAWGFPENWFRFVYNTDPTQCIVVSVEDDGMFSELRTGDRVVVDMSRTSPSPAGVFMLDDGHCWTPRHIELLPGLEPPTVMITARNPDYRSREAPLASLKIVGRVMGMWRRI